MLFASIYWIMIDLLGFIIGKEQIFRFTKQNYTQQILYKKSQTLNRAWDFYLIKTKTNF